MILDLVSEVQYYVLQSNLYERYEGFTILDVILCDEQSLLHV